MDSVLFSPIRSSPWNYHNTLPTLVTPAVMSDLAWPTLYVHDVVSYNHGFHSNTSVQFITSILEFYVHLFRVLFATFHPACGHIVAAVLC
jgi:hypothetical protein